MRSLWILPLFCLLCLPLSAAQGRTDFEPGLSLDYSWTSTGTETGEQHGKAVGLDGDFNGDNRNDLFVGAPLAKKTVDNEGVVYVFYGNDYGIAQTPHWIMGSTLKGSRFGESVASAGDVNHDYADDLLVGVPKFRDKENQLTDQGAVYLYQGGIGGLSDTPSWIYYGGQQGALFGASVSSAGDVNADGIEDVIIGASHHSYLFTNEGAAYLFLGSSTGLSPTPAWIAYGGSETAIFGSSVASAGDVNQDGYADVIVGAPGYDLPGTDNCGAAFIFLGSEDGLQGTPAWSFYGETASAQLGYVVSAAGDVDHDDYDDFLLGAPFHNGLIFPNEGAAYLFLGGEEVSSLTPGWIKYGGQENAYFGIGLAAAGDLNQDDYDDVSIGASKYTNDHSQEGRAYVFYGSNSGLLSSPSWWAEGNKAEATFGQVLGGNGDVNKDGYLDLVVGAPDYRVSEDKVGRAFLFMGVPDAVIPVDLKYLYLPMVVKAP